MISLGRVVDDSHRIAAARPWAARAQRLSRPYRGAGDIRAVAARVDARGHRGRSIREVRLGAAIAGRSGRLIALILIRRRGRIKMRLRRRGDRIVVVARLLLLQEMRLPLGRLALLLLRLLAQSGRLTRGHRHIILLRAPSGAIIIAAFLARLLVQHQLVQQCRLALLRLRLARLLKHVDERTRAEERLSDERRAEIERDLAKVLGPVVQVVGGAAQSDHAGHGVVAARPIRRGETIADPSSIFINRPADYARAHLGLYAYVAFGSHGYFRFYEPAYGHRSLGFFVNQAGHVADGEAPDPTARPNVKYASARPRDGGLVFALQALEDIPAGAELLANYEDNERVSGTRAWE